MFSKEKSSDLFNLSADLPTKKQQLQALNLLVILLPEANRDTLKVSGRYLPHPSERSREQSLLIGCGKTDILMEIVVVLHREKTCF